MRRELYVDDPSMGVQSALTFEDVIRFGGYNVANVNVGDCRVGT